MCGQNTDCDAVIIKSSQYIQHGMRMSNNDRSVVVTVAGNFIIQATATVVLLEPPTS